jgi:hypothetical protein
MSTTTRMMMLMAAAMTPEKEILENIESAQREYKLIPNEDNKGRLAMFAFMFLNKIFIELMMKEKNISSMEAIKKMSEEIDLTHKGFDLLNNIKPN